MSAGIILSQTDCDNMVGGLSRTVNTLLDQIVHVQATLNTLGTSGMVALPQGARVTAMTTDDASALLNAMNELLSLVGVARGTNIVESGGTVSAGSGHNFMSYPSNVFGWGF